MMPEKPPAFVASSMTLLLHVTLAFLSSTTHAEIRYEIQDLGTLGGGSTRGRALNDLGQVVGASTNSRGEMCAFIWDATDGIRQIAKDKPYSTFARDINNQGKAIGYGNLDQVQSATPGRRRGGYRGGYRMNLRGFVWTESGGEKALEFPGFEFVDPARINNRGQISGSCWNDLRNRLAVVWDASAETVDFRDLVAGSVFTPLLNDSGVFAGLHRPHQGLKSSARGESVPFIFDGENLVDIPRPEPTMRISTVLDINERNQVLVCASTGKATHPERFYVWDSGDGYTELATPKLTHVRVRAFNDRGEAVGSSLPFCPEELLEVMGVEWEGADDLAEKVMGEPEKEAIVWTEGEMKELISRIPAEPGLTLNNATDINNHGQIVVNGRIDEDDRAFLLTPVGSP